MTGLTRWLVPNRQLFAETKETCKFVLTGVGSCLNRLVSLRNLLCVHRPTQFQADMCQSHAQNHARCCRPCAMLKIVLALFILTAAVNALKFRADGTFRIVQLTDMHFGESDDKDRSEIQQNRSFSLAQLCSHRNT